jgi:ribonuclease T2
MTIHRTLCIALANIALIFAASTAQSAPTQPRHNPSVDGVEIVEPSESGEPVEPTEPEITYSTQQGTLIAKAAAGSFDYYVLAMSWSPFYCLTHANELQCSQKRSFILHGLWPNNFSGTNPADCPTTKTLTQKAIDIAFPVMTSKSLIEHEWDKHGTCDGRTSEAYYTNAVNEFKAVKVPSYLNGPKSSKSISLSQLRKDVIASSGFTSSQFAVICSGSKFKELRMCLNKSLNPTGCGSNVKDTCPATLTIDAPK